MAAADRGGFGDRVRTWLTIPWRTAQTAGGADFLVRAVERALATPDCAAARCQLRRDLAAVRLNSRWDAPPRNDPRWDGPLRGDGHPLRTPDAGPREARPTIATVVLQQVGGTALLDGSLLTHFLRHGASPSVGLEAVMRAPQDEAWRDLWCAWMAAQSPRDLAAWPSLELNLMAADDSRVVEGWLQHLAATPDAYALCGEWLWHQVQTYHPSGPLATQLAEDWQAIELDFVAVMGGRRPAGRRRGAVRPRDPLARSHAYLDRLERRLARRQQAHAAARAARQARRRAAAAGELDLTHWGELPTPSELGLDDQGRRSLLVGMHLGLLSLLACPDLPTSLHAWIGRYLERLLMAIDLGGPRRGGSLTPSPLLAAHAAEALITAWMLHPAALWPRDLEAGHDLQRRWVGLTPPLDPPADEPNATTRSWRTWWRWWAAHPVGQHALVNPLVGLSIPRALQRLEGDAAKRVLRDLLLQPHRDVRTQALRWLGEFAAGAPAPEIDAR